MLGGLVIAQALRRHAFAVLHEAVDLARRGSLPDHPSLGAAAGALTALGAAIEAGARYDVTARAGASGDAALDSRDGLPGAG